MAGLNTCTAVTRVVVECVMLEGTTNKSNQEVSAERCPLCQVPLCLVAEGFQHVLTCINICHAGLSGLIYFSVIFDINSPLLISIIMKTLINKHTHTHMHKHNCFTALLDFVWDYPEEYT